GRPGGARRPPVGAPARGLLRETAARVDYWTMRPVLASVPIPQPPTGAWGAAATPRTRRRGGLEQPMQGYEFSEYYFAHLAPIWTALFSGSGGRINKVLEIGSYEGGSSVWILENLLRGGGELHCIDTWQGGAEHQK